MANIIKTWLVALALCMMAVGFPPYLVADEVMQEIIVTSERRGVPRFRHVGNATILDDERIGGVKHSHIHELLTRISGVWVTRGSGQESLPSMRIAPSTRRKSLEPISSPA